MRKAPFRGLYVLPDTKVTLHTAPCVRVVVASMRILMRQGLSPCVGKGRHRHSETTRRSAFQARKDLESPQDAAPTVYSIADTRRKIKAHEFMGQQWGRPCFMAQNSVQVNAEPADRAQSL